ncbi:MAG TPA: branched-chain amino acid aminotransferase [Acidimicrobiales bacterium]|nr:branched-chain amino acid aminotransferase [Acidimicrobiales bacterium]
MDGQHDPNRPATSFGRGFTDHMVVATYTAASGWGPPRLEPFAELSLSPAAMVLHYGQAIFEGLKAFRQADGSVALFRPGANAERFDRSARRLAMPPLPPGVLTAACADLVRADLPAVPPERGHSLYLRPMMIATEAALGVRPADEYLFAVFASPAAAYFGDEVRPVTVWAGGSQVRAAPGGTGAAKCSGNYGASHAAKAEAVARGCDEVLWLDAAEHRWVEELGGMNIVFVADVDGRPTLVTPPLTDTILDGVTRRSLLELGPGLGLGVEVRPVALEEVLAGRFTEAFACGTAAAVVPVGAVRTPGGTTPIGGDRTTVADRVREALLDVQHGVVPDVHGWLESVAREDAAPVRC